MLRLKRTMVSKSRYRHV